LGQGTLCGRRGVALMIELRHFVVADGIAHLNI
jgi:hypothetical protein